MLVFLGFFFYAACSTCNATVETLCSVMATTEQSINPPPAFSFCQMTDVVWPKLHVVWMNEQATAVWKVTAICLIFPVSTTAEGTTLVDADSVHLSIMCLSYGVSVVFVFLSLFLSLMYGHDGSLHPHASEGPHGETEKENSRFKEGDAI